MIPLTAYVGSQVITLTEFPASLVGLTAIACTIHLFSFRKLLNMSKFNADNQQNILFVATVVFLELNGIKYNISKTENKSDFAFHVEWAFTDLETEQLRAIFCSLCIHNFKGIVPNQYTRRQIQSEWESTLTDNITVAEKKKIWKEQTKLLKHDFNKNKKVLHEIHKSILINKQIDVIENLIKNAVVR